jgi:hypothetical protein
MTLTRFEPVIPAIERSQTQALDRATTGNGISLISILTLSSLLQIRRQRGALLQGFQINLCTSLTSLTRGICPAHLILLYFIHISSRSSEERCKSRSSSIYVCISHPFSTCCFLYRGGPILSQTLLCQTGLSLIDVLPPYERRSSFVTIHGNFTHISSVLYRLNGTYPLSSHRSINHGLRLM